ncbi:hypothetical protein BC936DRAFT_150064 [Jimgerdemannia flammicorona]|uniref:THIF-type NAD/FAD binding fold domain-containing protein n=1 Tax=Jimgerdemannia flammicorona TaxID=994334 RepID=A0A433DMX8_9FUNG|nr:hypothetical protein BC936DRAFT_150064 [Jimgerdemannia flammicorona]
MGRCKGQQIPAVYLLSLRQRPRRRVRETWGIHDGLAATLPRDVRTSNGLNSGLFCSQKWHAYIKNIPHWLEGSEIDGPLILRFVPFRHVSRSSSEHWISVDVLRHRLNRVYVIDSTGFCDRQLYCIHLTQRMSTRDSHSNAILGKPLFERVASCRVLMVGAGGIGCELLKNLVLSGFKNVEVVDLDTIDLSNLNRQFLFQKQHIKKSKAHVAKESALKFNPSVNITSHHSNIKDPHFNVEWFKSFDIVMNALDNLDARRHVNMMCLAADVPLIESGTTGYLGQAYVIKKGQTECFDCSPKPTPTTYPVCTIRSTPSAPIHCIVWAKSYLFSQLFGKSEDEDEEILDKELTEENGECIAEERSPYAFYVANIAELGWHAIIAKEIEALKQETEELKAIKAAAGTDEYARKVFDKVIFETY